MNRVARLNRAARSTYPRDNDEVQARRDQQPEQGPDPEFSYFGRSLSRSRSRDFFKKPDQELKPELCYGSFSFKLSFSYVRKIEQNSI